MAPTMLICQTPSGPSAIERDYYLSFVNSSAPRTGEGFSAAFPQSCSTGQCPRALDKTAPLFGPGFFNHSLIVAKSLKFVGPFRRCFDRRYGLRWHFIHRSAKFSRRKIVERRTENAKNSRSDCSRKLCRHTDNGSGTILRRQQRLCKQHRFNLPI